MTKTITLFALVLVACNDAMPEHTHDTSTDTSIQAEVEYENTFASVEVWEGVTSEDCEIPLEYDTIINVAKLNGHERWNNAEWEELQDGVFVVSCGMETVRITYLQ